MSSKAPAAEETKNSAIEIDNEVWEDFRLSLWVRRLDLRILTHIDPFLGHPFDLAKTRLQAAALGAYTGAIDVVRKTLSRDGVTGVYRGMVPPLLGVTPIFAVSFWACDASKSLILALAPKRTSEKLSTAELAAAGFMSAVPMALITAPVERAKVLLQLQGRGGSEPQYKGVFDVMKHLYREGGIRSIFRELVQLSLVTDQVVPCPDAAGSSAGDLNLGAIMFAVGTAGVAMWSIAIPPDVLKSRMQSAPSGTYSQLPVLQEAPAPPRPTGRRLEPDLLDWELTSSHLELVKGGAAYASRICTLCIARSSTPKQSTTSSDQ
ncbi:mitochondrial carrier domain-containing protein [Suillus discolor]|uniref:Mitochondrial carrier domain-containing protein n=1 Tax=Suillus discolor TaxID=1912936 RepID=A0A9P7JQ53_9AGAM|nr:mitochondrial carrier domain-containing protein [Suillus discolor]KAG2097942.1 mitochondrial carrier domain-containing protein [Suillus discolor]